MTAAPPLHLTAPDGASVEIYTHGAHLASWVPNSAGEQLFLSRTSDFGPDASIRGGVPIIFPQFAGQGQLPKHGFARRMEWQQVNLAQTADSTAITLRLLDNAVTRAIWPYLFQADFTVIFGGPSLHLTLNVSNLGQEPFGFTGALHTYLRVADIHSASIHGLQGVSYIDSAAGNIQRIEAPQQVTFNAETDRIYLNPPERVLLQEPDRTLAVESSGFPDIVVWNPWEERGAALADLEPQGYLHMVCIEAALASNPYTLQPGQTWTGSQLLTVLS
jgi:glucose-6-phosphate 1-epimerase